MTYSKEVFLYQFGLVHSFIKNLAYYREAFRLYHELELECPVWTASIDGLLKVAVMDWCKVFGSDGCNQTHWKKLNEEDAEALQQSFRSFLFESTGLTSASWKKYHLNFCKFRNKYVAHTEIVKTPPAPPVFDRALDVAYAYDEWVRNLIKPDRYDGISFRREFENFSNDAKLRLPEYMKSLK